jgi:O-acetyl-ADP-ribose deacetylase (regulator of RNase III)
MNRVGGRLARFEPKEGVPFSAESFQIRMSVLSIIVDVMRNAQWGKGLLVERYRSRNVRNGQNDVIEHARSLHMMNFEIILSDTNEEVCAAFRQTLQHRLVTVEDGDLFEVAADAYAAPGNSHGIMDGGLDRLLRARFPGVEASVQRSIDRLGGLLPVGQAVTVETDDGDVPFLIYAPTMPVPGSLSTTRNVHSAMLAILRAVANHNRSNDNEIHSIAITGLGTGVGRLAPDAAASQMRSAFEEFLASHSN